MNQNSKIGIISTFAVFLVFVLLIEHTFSEDEMKIIYLLLQIPISIGGGFFVWYLVTKRDRKNARHTRYFIVSNMNASLTLINGMIEVEKNLENLDLHLTHIINSYEEIVHIAKTHSHLLDVVEIRDLESHKKIIAEYFVPQIRLRDNNMMHMLRNLEAFVRNPMIRYIKEHNVKAYKNYLR